MLTRPAARSISKSCLKAAFDGHGYLRRPTASKLFSLGLHRHPANQNEMHGRPVGPNFDYYMALVWRKPMPRIRNCLALYCDASDCSADDGRALDLLKKPLAAHDRQTYQAMEALIHNLNTMNSRPCPVRSVR
jgi:hypothetical protein